MGGRGLYIVCWSRTVVPRPINIGDFADRTRPMGRPRPSQGVEATEMRVIGGKLGQAGQKFLTADVADDTDGKET